MSHVDDGMLHAYLDGGLSALDAVRVERHVADCAACQQRLDGARRLIQRAARLLEWASPPAERAAPPLADLPPVVVPRWRVPVAWAATIVIALGAGIYGGQILLRDARRGAVSTLAPTSRDAEADQLAAPLTVLAESAPPSQTAPPAEPPAIVVAQAPAPTRDTTAAPNPMADAAAKSRADSVSALALGRSREEAATPAPAPAAPAPGALRDTAVVAGNQVAGERRAAQYSPPQAFRALPAAESGAVLPIITVDSARALLGTAPVVLPDYPVNAIRASAQGTVTVEQVVPPGRVIRLLQRRAAAEEEGRAAGEALARYVDGLRVEIVGPMPADSLSVLLGRARGMP